MQEDCHGRISLLLINKAGKPVLVILFGQLGVDQI